MPSLVLGCPLPSSRVVFFQEAERHLFSEDGLLVSFLYGTCRQVLQKAGLQCNEAFECRPRLIALKTPVSPCRILDPLKDSMPHQLEGKYFNGPHHSSYYNAINQAESAAHVLVILWLYKGPVCCSLSIPTNLGKTTSWCWFSNLWFFGVSYSFHRYQDRHWQTQGIIVGTDVALKRDHVPGVARRDCAAERDGQAMAVVE